MDDKLPTVSDTQFNAAQLNGCVLYHNNQSNSLAQFDCCGFTEFGSLDKYARSRSNPDPLKCTLDIETQGLNKFIYGSLKRNPSDLCES